MENLSCSGEKEHRDHTDLGEEIEYMFDDDGDGDQEKAYNSNCPCWGLYQGRTHTHTFGRCLGHGCQR